MNAASPRLVALIGASAGGLEPLRELVAAMPHDPRMAAIVAQHLAGSEPSALVRLLQAVTRIPVQPIADGMPLRGGLLYVTPPGHHVEIDGRVLRLYAAKSGPAPVPSLDRLFSSAARALGRHALAIVLSGTGQDGAVGARVVREAGGAVWTEQPSEAPFASMPQALIDRGLADHVASAVALGRRLGNWIDGPVAVHGTADMAGERAAFHALVERLGSRSGLDLGQYQEATLRRQFERVMRQHGASSLAQLAQDAQNDPQLVQALLQSLTIGVTEWLRNPSAFNALRLAWREYILHPGPPRRGRDNAAPVVGGVLDRRGSLWPGHADRRCPCRAGLHHGLGGAGLGRQ
ncbi:chemotaxis protein CheB [Tepidimonas fonticaldi]|nr:chemotaxis protein CheB [Tepidimonas fonticaldi]